MKIENIAQQLSRHAPWVVWCLQERHGKYTKVPYCARTGEPAKSNDASTWSPFDEAVAAYEGGSYTGIGFVVVSGGGLVGIDLDKCLDPQTGAIEPWAEEIVNAVPTYWEVSPSGRGLHGYAAGEIPAGPRRKGSIEVYDSGRYFAVTGEHLDGTATDVADCSDSLPAFYASVFGKAARTTPPAVTAFGTRRCTRPHQSQGRQKWREVSPTLRR